MVRKLPGHASASTSNAVERPECPWPADVVGLLTQVETLVNAGRAEEALALLGRSRTQSPWVRNAVGVCLLRLGKPIDAIEVFSPLVLTSGGLILRPDVPIVFRTNYATALLAAHNLPGGTWVLDEIAENSHPSCERLRNALRTWKASLTWWERISWALGGQPNRPVQMDFVPGDLA